MTIPINTEEANIYFLPNYGKRETVFVVGQGCFLKDNTGKEYLDFAGGVAVNHLGHCHPRLVSVLVKQAEKLWHNGNFWLNEPAIRLARSLVEKTFADKVFLCSSGLEANEAALKLARKYGREQGGEKKNKILCFDRAFHGRSLFTVAVGGKEEQRLPFGPLPAGIIRCAYNDVSALRHHMSDDFCAVILESIQGEAGVYVAAKEFFSEVRRLCDKHKALMILDEVQTGMGRTGSLFAYMAYDISPDIMTSSKALGGGFPVAALLTKRSYASYLSEGSHGSTFGGNALATAVAYESLQITDDKKLLAEVREKGEWLCNQLHLLNEKYDIWTEIRGRGLLIGAELKEGTQGTQLRQACHRAGLLILPAGAGEVLRFAPPLIVTMEELAKGISILESVLRRH